MTVLPLVVAVRADPSERRWVLHEATVVGRRGAGLNLLWDEYVSLRHAAFIPADGAWFVSTLASTNGTWVNKIQLFGSCELTRGDRVRIGHTTLIVVPA